MITLYFIGRTPYQSVHNRNKLRSRSKRNAILLQAHRVAGGWGSQI